jgi:hypothetical protein
VVDELSDIQRGSAGASAQREYQRRRARDEARVRARRRHLGELFLALRTEPQSISSWNIGAEGERVVGEHLDRHCGPDTIVLHDRRAGSRANIDHIVVSPAGLFVVDAKRYSGRVQRRNAAVLGGRGARLLVNGRDQTRLVPPVLRQAEVVERAVSPMFNGVRVTPVLCFVGAEWGFLAPPFEIDGVIVTWRQQLARRIRRGVTCLPVDALAPLARQLTAVFPRA